MGDEGLGQRPARLGLQRGGLHFEEAPAVEGAPQRGQQAAAGGQHQAGPRVDRQVQVAPAVPHLDVLQAVPLLRQGAQRLGEQGELGHLDAQLPPAGAHDLARSAHPVAGVEVGERREALPEHSAVGVQLDAARGVEEHSEGQAPQTAQRQKAPGHGDPGARARTGGEVAVGLVEAGGIGRRGEGHRIGVHAGGPQCLHLGKAGGGEEVPLEVLASGPLACPHVSPPHSSRRRAASRRG